MKGRLSVEEINDDSKNVSQGRKARRKMILTQGKVHLLILMLEGLGYGRLADIICVHQHCKKSADFVFRTNMAVLSSILVTDYV